MKRDLLDVIHVRNKHTVTKIVNGNIYIYTKKENYSSTPALKLFFSDENQLKMRHY